jgi:hypothetical protein
MSTTQNRLLQTITDSIPERISSSSPAGFAFDKASTYSSMPAESSTNWLFIFLFVIGLAFLGVNLVAYLAEGTQIFADITVPLAGWFAKTFGTAALETTEQTVKASSTGAKDAIDILADTTIVGVDTIQQTTGLTPGNNTNNNKNLRQYADTNQITGINAGKRVGQHISTLDEEHSTMDSLTKALQHSAQNIMTGSAPYSADDTTSSVQVKAKAGWCLIGEEKGARNCIEVGQNDQCMSGDIFPTHAVCVNPRLRA